VSDMLKPVARRERPESLQGNLWKESLGCEVKVCLAKLCDPVRMAECALRKTWIEMRDALLKRRDRAHSAGCKAVYTKRLVAMGAEAPEALREERKEKREKIDDKTEGQRDRVSRKRYKWNEVDEI
jgi:hypothetical protein